MKLSLLLISLITACTLPTIGIAGESGNILSGNVQFTTNNIGQGLALSVGNPSVEGELDYHSPNGLYANLSGSSINWVDQFHPGDSVSVEIEGAVGYRYDFDQDWLWRSGVIRAQFPGHYVQQSPPTDEPNTTEIFGYIGWKGLSAELRYMVTNSFATPDSRGSLYARLSATEPLGTAWSLEAQLGRQRSRGTNPNTGGSNSLASYTNYLISVTYAFHPDLSLTLAESWTNADPEFYTINNYDVAGHHLALTLEHDF